MQEPVARLLIELEEIKPRIWRRVDVPLSCTLVVLHDIMQVIMRWQDRHLFEFRVGEKVYGVPSDQDAAWGRKVLQAKTLRLGQLIDRDVRTFTYVYDFGDNWQHRITVESVFEGQPDVDYPVLVDGARRAPPEDVGGESGFHEFLDAMLDSDHPEHRQMLRWYNGPFDPEDIGRKEIEVWLATIAERRRGPLMRHRGARQEPH